MASKLTKWINAHLKAKGKSPKEAQKDAGKYSSISAAKKAGSLYYTDKKGRVMIAAYAEDLSKPLPAPKKRPEVVKPKKRPEVVTPKKKPEVVKPKKKKTIETKKIDTVAKKPNSKTSDDRLKVTTITIKEDNAGRSEKEKELDNLTKEIATFRMQSADRKATDKVKMREAREKIRKAQEKAASKDTNTQLRQMDALEMEAADRYRQPGQGSGRGLRGTQPEEFTKKVKYKPRKAKGGLIDMRSKGLFK